MGHNAEMLSKICTQINQFCQADDYFVDDVEWFVRVHCHFLGDIDRALLQLVDILNTLPYLNTKWTAYIRHWNVWTVDKKLCKV